MTLTKIYHHFKINDALMYNYIKKVKFDEWFKPKPTNENELFKALSRIIVGQQLSGKAATSIYSKFCAIFTEKSPSPRKVLKTDDLKLRESGLSWAKVKYVKDLAQNFIDKNIIYEDLEKLSDEEVIQELIKVKGLGRWSAEMFLMFTLHRENIFSHGDLGLNKGIEKIYSLTKPSKEEVEKIVSKWEPYKTFGSIALWDSLDNN